MVEFEDASFVFAHGWPIWAFALKGLGCKDIFIVVEW